MSDVLPMPNEIADVALGDCSSHASASVIMPLVFIHIHSTRRADPHATPIPHPANDAGSTTNLLGAAVVIYVVGGSLMLPAPDDVLTCLNCIFHFRACRAMSAHTAFTLHHSASTNQVIFTMSMELVTA